MKSLLSLLLVSLAARAVCQDTYQRFIHRYDVRVRENGRYVGLLYGGGRGTVKEFTTPAGREIEVNYLIEEETNRNLVNVEKFLEEEILFRYIPDRVPDRRQARPPYPFHENFPVLPSEGIQPGSVWTSSGFWTVRPRRDRPRTRIPVLIEYREAGTTVWGDRPVIVVNGLYALRYRRGQDPGGDPDLSSVQGRHEMTLYVDLQSHRPVFMRLRLTEQYAFVNGTSRQHEGFHLIWMEDARPLPDIPTLPRVAVGPPTPPPAGSLGTESGRTPAPQGPTAPANPPTGEGSGPTASSAVPAVGGASPTGPVSGGAADQSPTPSSASGGSIPATPATGSAPLVAFTAPEAPPQVLPLPTEPEVSVRRTERGIVLVPENLLFIADRADLIPNQEAKLQSIVRLLQAQPDRGVQVVGHTADVGRPSDELQLSRERAQRVAQLLIRLGVDARRIYVEGRGSREPRATNATEAGRALNRRVEIILRDD